MRGGLRHGRTLGSPIAIRVGNTEWPKWDKVMSADPVDADELDLVLLELHPRPAAVAEAPARERVHDVVRRHLDMGGETFEVCF